MPLSAFKELVRQRCGLMFEGVSEQLLREAVENRRRATANPSIHAYFGQAAADPGEFQELVNLLTINETYFFREPEHLKLLTERLAPRLLGRHDRSGAVRILSAGCSTGEEPYSIVIALREKYGEAAARLFAVAGCDIDQEALRRGRAGRYGGLSFRSLPPELKARYFVPEGSGFVVKEPVRSQVRLLHWNLMHESAPAGLGELEVIFFRNVSIYFDEPTRRAIQARLIQHLAPDGVLIVSAAETLANDFGLLPLVEEEGLFYFTRDPAAGHRSAPPPAPTAPRLPEPPRPVPAAVTAPVPAPAVFVPPPPEPAPAAPAADPDALIALLRERRFDEAAPRLAAWRAAEPEDARPHLLEAWLLSERRQLAQAERAAERALAINPWLHDACLLLGLIARRAGQHGAAVRWLKQAIYARPDCWPAHYHLAEIYRDGGDPERARREYRIVLSQLIGKPETGLTLLPLSYPVAEVRLICERRLNRPDPTR